jgi:hypothetical protein
VFALLGRYHCGSCLMIAGLRQPHRRHDVVRTCTGPAISNFTCGRSSGDSWGSLDRFVVVDKPGLNPIGRQRGPGSIAPVGARPVTPLVGLPGGRGGHLVGDPAGLVADLISAGIDVEDQIQHRAQHVLADVSVAAFERV